MLSRCISYFLAYIIVICENALPLILSVLWLRAWRSISLEEYTVRSVSAESFVFVTLFNPYNCSLEPINNPLCKWGDWVLQRSAILLRVTGLVCVGSGAQTEMGKPGFVCFATLPRKEDHVFLFSVSFTRNSRGNVWEEFPDRTMSYLRTLDSMVESLSGQIRQKNSNFSQLILLELLYFCISSYFFLLCWSLWSSDQWSRRIDGPYVPTMVGWVGRPGPGGHRSLNSDPCHLYDFGYILFSPWMSIPTTAKLCELD